MKRFAKFESTGREVYILAYENEKEWRETPLKGREIEPFVELEYFGEENAPLYRTLAKLREKWIVEAIELRECYRLCLVADWEKSAALFTYWLRDALEGRCEYAQEAISSLDEDEVVASVF